jgi:hypothetical protein
MTPPVEITILLEDRIPRSQEDQEIVGQRLMSGAIGCGLGSNRLLQLWPVSRKAE